MQSCCPRTCTHTQSKLFCIEPESRFNLTTPAHTKIWLLACPKADADGGSDGDGGGGSLPSNSRYTFLYFVLTSCNPTFNAMNFNYEFALVFDALSLTMPLTEDPPFSLDTYNVLQVRTSRCVNDVPLTAPQCGHAFALSLNQFPSA
jgi:hypothetical protein